MKSFRRAKEAIARAHRSGKIYWGLKSRIHKEKQRQQTQTPPISKLANELKQLPKELQIDLKYIQNLTSLTIKEIQIEKMWRFLSRPVQNGDYQGSNKYWREQGMGRMREPLLIPGGNAN